MKSKLLSIIYMFVFFCVNAQSEADFLYTELNDFSVLNNPLYSTTILKFNADSLEEIDDSCTIATSNFYSGATYSDKYGNWKFTSNGWRVVNSYGEVLSYRLWSDSIPWPSNQPDTTLVDYSKGPLFLTNPGDSNQVYLFYSQAKRNIFPQNAWLGRFDILLTYALLDITTQKLISKNNIVLSDTGQLSNLNAVRHANGRDWWIVKPGVFTNEYYVGLLNPIGISFQKITFSELTPREQVFIIAHFNEEGTKLLHFTLWRSKFIQSYDFDRCTGELSNPQEYDLTGLLRNGENNNFAISPDGSKAYLQRMLWQDSLIYLPGTFQYDLELRTFTKISSGAGATFLAPNYKSIFFRRRKVDSIGTGTLYLSEINNPNGSGVLCNVEEYKYPILNSIGMVTHPGYANYRLGALVGSPCDTIRPKKTYTGGNAVFPNPFASGFTLQLATVPVKPLLLKVHNIIGQLVAEVNITQQTTQIPVKETTAAGLYLLRLFAKKGKGERERGKLKSRK